MIFYFKKLKLSDDMMLKIVESNSRLEDLLEWTLCWTGIILLFLGLIGIIIIFSEYKIITDRTLQMVFIFVSIYMLFFGIILILYRKKIIVRS